jgi:fermentation-respiration switch protein FrsA (DUF1100 family)
MEGFDTEYNPTVFLDFANFAVKLKTMGKAPLFLAGLGISMFSSKFLYHPKIPGSPVDPDKNYPGFRNPSERNMEYLNLQIKTKDLQSLQGWFMPRADSKKVPTVVFFHENAGNIGLRLEYLQKYADQVNVNILIVAYRGFSKSSGNPDQKGIEIDAESILETLFDPKKQLAPLIDLTSIYLHGRSLGGAVVVYAGGLEKFKDRIKGVILENTFTSIPDVVKHFGPDAADLVDVLLKGNNDWPTLSRIPSLKASALFIASMADELVPPKQMLRLFEVYSQSAGSSKKVELYKIEEGDHNCNWNLDEAGYFKRIAEFLKETA